MSKNLNRVVKDLNFQGEDFIVTFDMRSIPVFKELSGKSYINSISTLSKLDDEDVINFFGATMRRKTEPKKPIGEEVYDMNIATLLFSHYSLVVEVIAGSMPQNSPGKTKGN